MGSHMWIQTCDVNINVLEHVHLPLDQMHHLAAFY